jgi:hypothetical protein
MSTWNWWKDVAVDIVKVSAAIPLVVWLAWTAVDLYQGRGTGGGAGHPDPASEIEYSWERN